MAFRPLSKQVLVITGATSGIGLVTARLAAQRGARVALCARNANALRRVVDDILRRGGEVIGVAGDVANGQDLERLAKAAVAEWGRIDTWVNNAGVSIYGELLEVDEEDHRRLFETNYWGVVHGSRIACNELRERGGVLINIGSVLSDRAIPLQGAYCASKHAVKGFTDALRMEVEKARLPIAVCLVKPSAIDTPYKDHAKNYLQVEPKNPAPVYAPQVVAEAILTCAERPQRDVFVGLVGRILSAFGNLAPRLADRYMKLVMFSSQQKASPAKPKRSALYRGSEDTRERGGYEGHVFESSEYTKAATRLNRLGAVALAGGVMAAMAFWAKRHSGTRMA
jgi:short-subunit dehydrogenase